MTPFSAWNGSELSVYWPILVQGALVSVALGLVGCFLVVRGISLLGDALSHSVLPGIVVGFLIGGSLHSPWILIGATAMGVAAALLTEAVPANSRVKADASLGIVFTTLFALGVVMINAYAGQADLDPGCVLYGNIEYFVSIDGTAPPGMTVMAVILACIVLGIFVFYRQLLVTTFDPAFALSQGVPARLVHYGLLTALSLTTVASFESVGAILAVALLILPGATARLWTDRLPAMLLLAAAHGIFSTPLGYWLSHESVLNTSASGAICVAGFGLFLASWLFAPSQGILTRYFHRRRLATIVALDHLLRNLEQQGGRSASAAVGENLHFSSRQLKTVVQRAGALGWVRTEGVELILTDSGTAHSRRVERAHELWERYLQSEVGLAPDHVHDAAEWIEHHLSDERLDELERLLTQP